MITCRPSGPARSLTSPSSAKSIARAPVKLVGEGARGTTVGSALARQNTVAGSAESFGSTAKGKPPTPDEGIPGAALEAGVGGVLAHDSLVVFLISRITAQELPRKAGPIKVLQVVASPDAPVGTSRHLSSPKTLAALPWRRIQRMRANLGVVRSASGDARWASLLIRDHEQIRLYRTQPAGEVWKSNRLFRVDGDWTSARCSEGAVVAGRTCISAMRLFDAPEPFRARAVYCPLTVTETQLSLPRRRC